MRAAERGKSPLPLTLMLGIEYEGEEMKHGRGEQCLPDSFIRKTIIGHVLCSTLVVLAYTIYPICSVADAFDQKIDYELQERCGITSARWAGEHKEVVDYQAHYNKKQNKCVIYATLAPIKSGNTYTSYYMVYDPNANKTLAQYTVRSGLNYEDRICIVGGKSVEAVSEEKWNKIVKGLLEE